MLQIEGLRAHFSGSLGEEAEDDEDDYCSGETEGEGYEGCQ